MAGCQHRDPTLTLIVAGASTKRDSLDELIPSAWHHVEQYTN
ncbi:hypothetical protein [Dactylosporangium sp. CA-233914]